MSNLGRVKFFKGERGWGYISCLGSNEDYFVHQSNIKPAINRYRYLTKGEYVSFDTAKDESKEIMQAVNVTGVQGGPLLCDAHLEVDDDGNVTSNGPPVTYRPRGRGHGGGRGRGAGDDSGAPESTQE